MVISLCVPCMNRTRELKQSLPYIVAAANASPPVEIVVLDYSSPDDLYEYLQWARDHLPLADGNSWRTPHLLGKRYYNSAHARNLCVRAASGDYIVQLSTEAEPTVDFLPNVRERIATRAPVWLSEKALGRFFVIRRDAFEAAGGYDERFKLYSPEDKDLSARLFRRGLTWERFAESLIYERPTPHRRKWQNLDLSGFENVGQKIREMSRSLRPIYERNCADGVLVANPSGWGKWE